MAIYTFFCSDCQEAYEIKRPMSQSGLGLICAKCENPAKRTYTVPQISVPVYMATDVMNEYASGDRVVPGQTREQTMFYANGLAKMQKKNKGKKDGSLAPTISTASSPVATPYNKTD